MLDAPFALAFTAGMIATVNPCGFAMLPAYLGYFLGLEGSEEADPTAGLARALLVGASVSAGFIALFAVVGAAISWTSLSVVEWSPWLTVVIGLGLAALGLGFALGWEPTVALPRLDRGGRDRGLWSMFLFGLSYAVASLSCTIGPFTGTVASSFSGRSVLSGILTFLSYAAGMSLLLMALTVTLALARRGLLTGLRRALPFVQRASGVVMVVTGAYLAWYGVYEIRLIQRGETDATAGPVGTVTGWSGSFSRFLDGVDPVQAALVLALVITSAVLVILLRPGRHHAGPTPPDEA